MIKKRFSRAAMDLLMGYNWPGNVRELANVIERSVLLSGSREEIVVDDFPEGMLGDETSVIEAAGPKLQISRQSTSKRSWSPWGATRRKRHAYWV
jgi:transcriptional regulator with PAS, ATPase and Fis domain